MVPRRRSLAPLGSNFGGLTAALALERELREDIDVTGDLALGWRCEHGYVGLP
jgi:hypothetical protein